MCFRHEKAFRFDRVEPETTLMTIATKTCRQAVVQGGLSSGQDTSSMAVAFRLANQKAGKHWSFILGQAFAGSFRAGSSLSA